jgi:hypothetical protein
MAPWKQAELLGQAVCAFLPPLLRNLSAADSKHADAGDGHLVAGGRQMAELARMRSVPWVVCRGEVAFGDYSAGDDLEIWKRRKKVLERSLQRGYPRRSPTTRPPCQTMSASHMSSAASGFRAFMISSMKRRTSSLFFSTVMLYADIIAVGMSLWKGAPDDRIARYTGFDPRMVLYLKGMRFMSPYFRLNMSTICSTCLRSILIENLLSLRSPGLPGNEHSHELVADKTRNRPFPFAERSK